MSELDNASPGPCGGSDCTFNVAANNVGCRAGGNDCWQARMAEAEVSAFHDQTLADATQQIKQVLASIPDDPQGRKVSFLRTPRGLMLAWVNHGADVPTDAVPASADEETLAQALKLKPASAASGS